MENNKLMFFNGFGITPTKNFTAAGYDFYVPDLNDTNEEQIKQRVLPAFETLYGVTPEESEAISSALGDCVYECYGPGDYDESEIPQMFSDYIDCYNINKYNVLHLYLAFMYKREILDYGFPRLPLKFSISEFIYNNLCFDLEAGKAGITLNPGDMLMVNSGIKEVLPHNYAGVFLNKSGRGSSGLDVRAQVVDEDYSGYVCLNVSFYAVKDRLQRKYRRIYCGDKLVQQLILPLFGEPAAEVTSEEEYNRIMSGSERGDAGFGSSNEVH